MGDGARRPASPSVLTRPGDRALAHQPRAPGGHADGDADLAHVAWREATEETGIEGLVVVVPAVHLDVHEVRPPSEDPHLHLDVRHLVLAPPGAVVAGNHESEALRWVQPDELPELGADDGLLELARRAGAVLDALACGSSDGLSPRR